MPQILVQLKESIEVELENLSEQEAHNVIEGYSFAPHTLPRDLLISVKKRIIEILKQHPFKLNTPFISNFVIFMYSQQEGIKYQSTSIVIFLVWGNIWGSQKL
ncbi:hypothetical protein PPERSA_11763 [Pseudocohnilembus persalinus]|uniref:Uncharacterized protein n=1 Tax=Pseudocohnilembus persalinus TaxID=266149 RepID=A0A0V0QGP5_PSEPJ|nr:hypothetical protein PPERSA_11763 [Pseudocohnilembus persalinus]|eukprot:KRX01316.1 hypothetical protein PPERSA_11763 [Pseudocohnilembus persalinus]